MQAWCTRYLFRSDAPLSDSELCLATTMDYCLPKHFVANHKERGEGGGGGGGEARWPASGLVRRSVSNRRCWCGSRLARSLINCTVAH